MYIFLICVIIIIKFHSVKRAVMVDETIFVKLIHSISQLIRWVSQNTTKLY